jgi:hypothetical protein
MPGDRLVRNLSIVVGLCKALTGQSTVRPNRCKTAAAIDNRPTTTQHGFDVLSTAKIAPLPDANSVTEVV